MREGAPGGYRCGFVALLGRPNVGKSTLVNRLVGGKAAIVTPRPQTTRHRILGIRTEADRQFVFVDTPGVHEPKTRMGELMVRAAWAAAAEADVVVVMQDVLRPLGADVERLIVSLRERVPDRPRIHLLNKIDRARKDALLPRIERTHALDPDARAWIPISALTGDGVDRFLEEAGRLLPEHPPLYPEDWWTDQRQEQLAAEYVREKLFLALRDEVPFQTAVDVERFAEDEDGAIVIDATIWVHRPSQKPIVIGRGGQRLKEIGMRARRDLEELLGRHVRLHLWVKIAPDWFDRIGKLRELGLDRR